MNSSSNDVVTGSDRHVRTSSASSYGSGNAFHIDDSIDEEREGFLNRYHHANDRGMAELNNSDSNSSTDDSHNRRVALMMASPGRPPRSNSSREKQRRRTRPSSRRTIGEINDKVSPIANRRRQPKSTISSSHKRRLSSDKSHISEYSTTEMSSGSSPDTSPSRHLSDMFRLDQNNLSSPYQMGRSSSGLSFSGHRRSQSSSSITDESYDPKSTARKSPNKGSPPPRDFKSVRTKSSSSNKFSLSKSFFGIILMSILGMITLTTKVSPPMDRQVDESLFSRPTVRGKQVLLEQLGSSDSSEDVNRGKIKIVQSKHTDDVKINHSSPSSSNGDAGKKMQPKNTETSSKETPPVHNRLQMRLPPPLTLEVKPQFEMNDRKIYYPSKPSDNAKGKTIHPRTIMLDPAVKQVSRKIEIYPADFTDNTQFYGLLDSDDERLNRMEIREPYSKDECVPMQEWQTAYQPSCNGMHELALQTLGESSKNIGNPEGMDATLFGTKGFWRYAWKLVIGRHDEKSAKEDTIVFKNLKYEHNFEDAHFEHDRVDAVAMERLTSSPHVINIFGFCGHSVLTEYADGKRVGQLADKAKKVPLKRIEIARDIANGLADVHGIDGDGNTTFVHLDVNPANVVSVNGTLKLNDFNIGIIRQWNTTSNEPCGFPAQYPNPQWRSPEEARNEQHLTEKVDVFSLGHIFFRLICGHEPWNKLEPEGKPSKEEIDVKVQRGDLPFIPEEVLNSKDPEVVAIREVMLQCYTVDPKQRPSARNVAQKLDEVYNLLKEEYVRNPPTEKPKAKKPKKKKAKPSKKVEDTK